MIKRLFFTLFICVIFAYPTKAATWDEPWHDEVMRISESFVKVKITATQDSGVKESFYHLGKGSDLALLTFHGKR